MPLRLPSSTKRLLCMLVGRHSKSHNFNIRHHLSNIFVYSLQPATDNYPLSMLPIANKPLLTYQIEYLQRNGIHKIFVVVEKKHLNKVEAYMNKFYESQYKSEIELIALQDEEESANVLKLLKDKITVWDTFS